MTLPKISVSQRAIPLGELCQADRRFVPLPVHLPADSAKSGRFSPRSPAVRVGKGRGKTRCFHHSRQKALLSHFCGNPISLKFLAEVWGNFISSISRKRPGQRELGRIWRTRKTITHKTA